MKKGRKPKHTFWLWAYYWWNPFVWIIYILGFPASGILGFFRGIKNWYVLTKTFFKEFDIK